MTDSNVTFSRNRQSHVGGAQQTNIEQRIGNRAHKFIEWIASHTFVDHTYFIAKDEKSVEECKNEEKVREVIVSHLWLTKNNDVKEIAYETKKANEGKKNSTNPQVLLFEAIIPLHIETAVEGLFVITVVTHAHRQFQNIVPLVISLSLPS